MGSSDWERVLQQDAAQESSRAPEGATTLAADRRPLYERLQEQRAKRQADYLESLRLANRAAVLLDEDVAYLEGLERRRHDEELARQQEEEASLEAFRKQKRTKAISTKVGDAERPAPTDSLGEGGLGDCAPAVPLVAKKRTMLGIKPKRKP